MLNIVFYLCPSPSIGSALIQHSVRFVVFVLLILNKKRQDKVIWSPSISFAPKDGTVLWRQQQSWLNEWVLKSKRKSQKTKNTTQRLSLYFCSFIWFLSVLLFFFSPKESWGIHNIMAFILFEMRLKKGRERGDKIQPYTKTNKMTKIKIKETGKTVLIDWTDQAINPRHFTKDPAELDLQWLKSLLSPPSKLQ